MTLTIVPEILIPQLYLFGAKIDFMCLGVLMLLGSVVIKRCQVRC
jgi:hypothetical protein